jgi:sugar fermentation stimulation protein A
MIKEFSSYNKVKPEITTSKGTRLDFLLEGENQKKAYVEVKNCTLVEKRHAYFPDAVTIRGQKHLKELERLVFEGFETAVFFLIQRTDADFFSPADHIDPGYGKLLRQVYENGVKIIVYDTLVKPGSIELNKRVKIRL